MKPTNCPECNYVQTERAGLHLDSHATREEADRMAASERCPEHQPQPKQEELI
jgi:hypothetical protein